MASLYTLLAPDGTAYQSGEKGRLGGHRAGRIYGRLDCPSALRHIARGGYVQHRVFFADEAAAIGAGYRPCGVCMRARYDVWKAGGTPETEAYPWKRGPQRAEAGRRACSSA